MKDKAMILVVDDSSLIRLAVSRTLVAHGYEVIVAEAGQPGLVQWESRKTDIDLVLSDVFMPGLDGFAFARELRNRRCTAPIILMSSKLTDDNRWIAEDEGFQLIPKPFKDENLLGLIRETLPA
jgi:DNA-binding response OmpR family regulator